MFRKKIDLDNPPLTDMQLSNMRPFKDVFPELAAQDEAERRKIGRPRKDVTKSRLSMRVDSDVMEKIKALGPGYQTKVNNWLREMVGV